MEIVKGIPIKSIADWLYVWRTCPVSFLLSVIICLHKNHFTREREREKEIEGEREDLFNLQFQIIVHHYKAHEVLITSTIKSREGMSVYLYSIPSLYLCSACLWDGAAHSGLGLLLSVNIIKAIPKTWLQANLKKKTPH